MSEYQHGSFSQVSCEFLLPVRFLQAFVQKLPECLSVNLSIIYEFYPRLKQFGKDLVVLLSSYPRVLRTSTSKTFFSRKRRTQIHANCIQWVFIKTPYMGLGFIE